MGAISDFIRHHYRHFNGATLVDAADAYVEHVNAGGQMLVTLAGAMSTAELGLSLAEMIRQGKVHAICCTGANLEEDVFNLVAHDHYVRIPNYRYLTPEQEEELLDQHLNRVTDTCIPEEEAIRRIEDAILDEWTRADAAGERLFPHEFLYRILRSRMGLWSAVVINGSLFGAVHLTSGGPLAVAVIAPLGMLLCLVYP